MFQWGIIITRTEWNSKLTAYRWVSLSFISKMTPIQIIFLVGICVFGLGTIITTVVGIVYFSWGNSRIGDLNLKDKYRKYWPLTLWIYGVLFIDCFLLFMLYLVQYFGQGITQNLSGVYVIWGRWLIFIIISWVNSNCLTYVMTRHSDDIQSKIYVLTNVLAFIFFFFASLSQSVETRSSWIAGSAFMFIIALLSYVLPYNKWRVVDSKFHTDIKNAPWGAYYHRAFYIIFILAYVFYFLIWIISPVNGLTAMTTTIEAGLYLAIDSLSFLIFAFYMFITTHTLMHQHLHITCNDPILYNNVLKLTSSSGVSKK